MGMLDLMRTNDGTTKFMTNFKTQKFKEEIELVENYTYIGHEID